MTLTIREARLDDVDALLELNDEGVPGVNRIDASELRELIGASAATLVAEQDGVPAGFVLTLRPGAEYTSENYRYFNSRGTDFLYVDRIAVSAAYRSAGIGRALYAAVFERARDLGAHEVCCEVNLDPPNPGSSRFHRGLGFVALGSQSTKGGEVRVELLAAPVTGMGRIADAIG